MPKPRRTWIPLALSTCLLLACGSGEDEPVTAEATPAPAATPTPAAPSEEAPSAGEEAPELTGCPSSPECMSGCRGRCEAEHGPMMDLARMRECTTRGGDPGACVGEATNDESRRCFLTCRGLSVEDFPLAR